MSVRTQTDYDLDRIAERIRDLSMELISIMATHSRDYSVQYIETLGEVTTSLISAARKMDR